MKQQRDSKGRFTRTKQYFFAFLVGLLILGAVTAIILGDTPIKFAESYFQEEVYEAEVDNRDNIQRLTDNYGEKLRTVMELEAELLEEQKEVSAKQVELSQALEELNVAVESINIYSN